MGFKEKLNPMAKFKEITAALPSLKVMQDVSKNQQEQIRIQVKEIQNQTIIMQRWAAAAEAQMEQMERMAKALEKIAKK